MWFFRLINSLFINTFSLENVFISVPIVLLPVWYLLSLHLPGFKYKETVNNNTYFKKCVVT